MDPATMAILASVLGPMLAGAFGGGGSSSGGALGLMNDPEVLAQLKQAMFGIGANGQSDFYGGLVGQQYKQAVDKAPLQAAITRMAGKLLPRAYQPGVIDGLGGSNSDGMPPFLQRNGTTDGPSTTVRLTPPSIPGFNNGGGGGDGREPGGRLGKQTLAPPTYDQLLAQLQGNG
jgi:hypothetical protein